MTSSQDEQVGNSDYTASYNYLVSSGVTFDTSSRVQMAKVINKQFNQSRGFFMHSNAWTPVLPFNPIFGGMSLETISVTVRLSGMMY